MANDEEKVGIEETEAETPEEELNEATDWKAEAKKARGIAQRLRTKLVKATEKKVAPEPTAHKAGFDYAEKAFLKSSGIATSEYDFVKEVMQATGKPLDDVLESKYFQAELKERRDENATRDAVPTNSKRSSSPARDTVEYWIAKGELPKDNPELSRKVTNAKLAAAKSRGTFSGGSGITIR